MESPLPMRTRARTHTHTHTHTHTSSKLVLTVYCLRLCHQGENFCRYFNQPWTSLPNKKGIGIVVILLSNKVLAMKDLNWQFLVQFSSTIDHSQQTMEEHHSNPPSTPETAPLQQWSGDDFPCSFDALPFLLLLVAS